jgi:hypothetical protein
MIMNRFTPKKKNRYKMFIRFSPLVVIIHLQWLEATLMNDDSMVIRMTVIAETMKWGVRQRE